MTKRDLTNTRSSCNPRDSRWVSNADNGYKDSRMLRPVGGYQDSRSCFVTTPMETSRLDMTHLHHELSGTAAACDCGLI